MGYKNWHPIVIDVSANALTKDVVLQFSIKDQKINTSMKKIKP